MSVEQLETTIEAMSAGEREKFARWFDDQRHELIPDTEAAQRREVLSRLTESESDPAALESFEKDDLEHMIGAAAHARTQKAPVGRG
jgi:hypothetical protein